MNDCNPDDSTAVNKSRLLIIDSQAMDLVNECLAVGQSSFVVDHQGKWLKMNS